MHVHHDASATDSYRRAALRAPGARVPAHRKIYAELIRDSVYVVYGFDKAARRGALESLLAEEPMPVEDWEIMKQDLMDSLSGPVSPAA